MPIDSHQPTYVIHLISCMSCRTYDESPNLYVYDIRDSRDQINPREIGFFLYDGDRVVIPIRPGEEYPSVERKGGQVVVRHDGSVRLVIAKTPASFLQHATFPFLYNGFIEPENSPKIAAGADHEIDVVNGILRVVLLGKTAMIMEYGSNGNYDCPQRQIRIYHGVNPEEKYLRLFKGHRIS